MHMCIISIISVLWIMTNIILHMYIRLDARHFVMI